MTSNSSAVLQPIDAVTSAIGSEVCVELPTVSIVIAARNAEAQLGLCLEAIASSQVIPLECIVVDDASTDKTVEIALGHNVRVLKLPARSGPAAARNRGARIATGTLLLFLDSDVVVSANTIRLAAEAFRDDPELDALMGCYDDSPAANNFASQFEGLHHHYMHQTAPFEARGLAGFCSAAKRTVFLDSGGFDERYTRPSIEDVELGLRLSRQGKKLRLMKQVQVKHLKRWTFLSLVCTEVSTRAVPWARLVLSTGSPARDLNLAPLQKLSAALVIQAVFVLPIGVFNRSPGLIALAAAGLILVVAFNRAFYAFLYARGGSRFLAKAIPMHLFYFLYASVGFAAGGVAHLFAKMTSRVKLASVITE